MLTEAMQAEGVVHQYSEGINVSEVQSDDEN